MSDHTPRPDQRPPRTARTTRTSGSSGSARPTYLVLNRFDDEFGEYHRFVPAGDCRLVYLTTAAGLGVLRPADPGDLVVVDDTGLDTVRPAARRLAARVGGLHGVVGLSEYDLLTAARLRADLGVPGPSVDLVQRFRDKPLMKRLVGAAGLRVPRHTILGPASRAEDLARELTFPLIVKPRAGAASAGVTRVDTIAELHCALAGIDPAERAEYAGEEFVAGEIFHVDGIRRDGRLLFVSVSGYVNTCLDFAHGAPLGSVLLDPGPRRTGMVSFAAACLDALGLADGPFHLELIERADGEPVFLEVGCRPGGAEVPFLHRDLFGIDLMQEAFRATVGLPPVFDPGGAAPAVAASPPGGGWVVFPEPRPWPSRVVARTSLIGAGPGVYAERLPAVGSVLTGAGGYDHAGGSFRLRGSDEVAVRRAVTEVIARYRLVVEPARDPAVDPAVEPAAEPAAAARGGGARPEGAALTGAAAPAGG